MTPLYTLIGLGLMGGSLAKAIKKYNPHYTDEQLNDAEWLKKEIVKHGESLPPSPGIGSLQDGSYPLGRLLENELEEEIAKAISRLPEECRKVFRMSRFSGLKYDEIARQSGISVNTVKYHIKHALELLAKDLHRYLISLVLMLLPGC